MNDQRFERLVTATRDSFGYLTEPIYWYVVASAAIPALGFFALGILSGHEAFLWSMGASFIGAWWGTVRRRNRARAPESKERPECGECNADLPVGVEGFCPACGCPT